MGIQLIGIQIYPSLFFIFMFNHTVSIFLTSHFEKLIKRNYVLTTYGEAKTNA